MTTFACNPDESAGQAVRFAVRFEFPEGEMFAGIHKGAFGWAPTLATALIYDDRESAERVIANAYGEVGKQYGVVVEVMP